MTMKTKEELVRQIEARGESGWYVMLGEDGCYTLYEGPFESNALAAAFVDAEVGTKEWEIREVKGGVS